MDWGLGNPNKTAALIVMLMIAVWGFAYTRKLGFWIALALFAGLGICLMHTFSRGGMVALGAGLVPLLWTAPRPWPRKRIVAISCAVWAIAGASIYLQAHNRLMQGIVKEDRSITHRIDIWEKTPQMIVDAPGGWGLGQSSKVYKEWYQPFDRNEEYLNLINSHLTWLVEISWGWRFLYLCGWLAVLCLCLPSGNFRWFSISFGIWLAFAVASIFTHVAESPWLWILPVASLLAVLVSRLRSRLWLPWAIWPGIAGVSFAVLLSIYWVGSSTRNLKIRAASNNEVIIGGNNAKVWIAVNASVMGERYGKTLRRYLEDSKGKVALGLVTKTQDLQNQNDGPFVIAGAANPEDLNILKAKTKLILLNPSFYPQEIDFSKSKSVTVYFGEFSQSPSVQAWQDQGVVHMVEGKGDFLANWPELVFSASHHE